MSGIEYELFTKWQREFILKKCLAGVQKSEKYDYILIDAPPTLGGWVIVQYDIPATTSTDTDLNALPVSWVSLPAVS